MISHPAPCRARRARTFGLAAALAACVLATSVGAQGAASPIQQSGPVISAGGPSALVPNPAFAIPDGHVFKVMWEINQGSETEQSAQLGTVARFYNLHVRNGVPQERLFAAAVVHGTGWIALLTDEAHQARYGRPNPSKQLAQQLIAAGARLAVCGQTAAFRGLRQEELLPGVQVATSAMTALSVFYAEGYRLQPWR